MQYFWYAVGVVLLGWAGYNLYEGYVVAWDVIYKSTNPVAYWSVLAVYAGLGVSCFFASGGGE